VTDDPTSAERDLGVVLDAGAPLEPARHPVGRRSTVLLDTNRAGRAIPVDCWYPAARDHGERSVYEILPGIGYSAAARTDAPILDAALPLVVWSHGRTGTRTAYALLCEGLAARGYVVVAPDHAGDTLLDWMLGAAVDDDTNGVQRVADLQWVLDAVLDGGTEATSGLVVDRDRVAVAGHSYGAWSALALAGAEPPDPRVRAVAGLQSFTRTLTKAQLGRVTVPTLLVVGALDATTPPSTDADRAFALLRACPDARRIDIAAAGHQACSDVGLYLELAPQVAGLPDLVTEYLAGLADQVTGRAGDPWRPTVAQHLDVLGSFLGDVL
jgi:predicted dienelactone hydrolase